MGTTAAGRPDDPAPADRDPDPDRYQDRAQDGDQDRDQDRDQDLAKAPGGNPGKDPDGGPGGNPGKDPGRDLGGDPDKALARKVRRGLVWSGLNTLTLRLGSVLVGVLLARVLAPEDFGAFGVALAVQTILVTLAELGMSVDLIRNGDVHRRGPTVTTLSIAVSAVLAVIMCLTAGPVATVLGSPEADDVVRVLSITIVLSAIGVAPYAVMQREFMQSRQFAVDGAGFVISTALTVVLALAGLGAMSMALARVASQVVSTCMQFWFTGLRPRVGWDPGVAGPAVRLGLPLAVANLLSWVLMNVDYMVVGNRSGAVLLGMYVLAFNISSWPMSVVGQAVRSVALPGFARLADLTRSQATRAVATATGLTWAAALPMGLVLALFARPLIEIVYGARWLPGAAALAGLGVFGAFRVTFDLITGFLVSRASRTVLWVQVLWILALAPVMLWATEHHGLAGAGWAHVFVAVAVAAPAYLWALRRLGVGPGAVLAHLVPPALAAVPASVLVWWLLRPLPGPYGELLVGAPLFVVAYALPLVPWVRRLRRPPARHARRDRELVPAALPVAGGAAVTASGAAVGVSGGPAPAFASAPPGQGEEAWAYEVAFDSTAELKVVLPAGTPPGGGADTARLRTLGPMDRLRRLRSPGSGWTDPAGSGPARDR